MGSDKTMCWNGWLHLLLLNSLLIITTAGFRLVKFDVPRFAVLGSDVTLICQFDLGGDRLYSVKWYKERVEFYRYIPSGWPMMQTAYQIEGATVDLARSDDQRLHLRNIILSSEGNYRCEVSIEAPSFQTFTKTGVMQVIDDIPIEDPSNLLEKPSISKCRFLDVETAVCTWLPPQVKYRNGQILHYEVEFGESDALVKRIFNTTETRAIFQIIDHHVDYEFKVKAWTSQGDGPNAYVLITALFDPLTDPPDAISILNGMATSDSSIELWWSTIPYVNSTLTGFQVFYTLDPNAGLDLWNKKSVPVTGSAELQNLDRHAIYTIAVVAMSCKGPGFISEYLSLTAIPLDVVINLKAHYITTHSANLTWSPPVRLNPKRYVISFGGEKEFVDSQGLTQTTEYESGKYNVSGTTQSLILQDLKPFTTYNINVTALSSSQEYTPPVKMTFKTKMAAPEPMVSPDFYGVRGEHELDVLLPRASEEYGPIAYYILVVVPEEHIDTKPDYFSEYNLISNSKSNMDGVPYITAKFLHQSIPFNFTIGDGNIYEGFRNKQLHKYRRYMIFVRAIVDSPLRSILYTSSWYSSWLSLNMNKIPKGEMARHRNQFIPQTMPVMMKTTILDECEVIKFMGNTTHNDHFKLLLLDSSMSLLVGGKNMIYNLSLDNLAVQNRLEWYPEDLRIQMCYLKGGSKEECQNYIRVLIEKKYGEYLICGTNAYNPTCRDFILTDGVLTLQREFAGRGLCPFDPSFNNTFTYVDGQLYVGNIADFAGLEPLIYREPLRTEQYDLSLLNEPSFVSSFAIGDYVYFFFREIAVECMNCGKIVYSRVAKVCRHDKGGPHKFRNKWTSYLKSRLTCSIAGDHPFYFNEIQATTAPVEGRYGDYATTLIYGIFKTHENSTLESAVCAFTFQDIMDTFEGPFKGQATNNASWLPVNETQVPEPRPGQCVRDSSTLPDVTLNFIRVHSLMDEAVPAFFDQPLLISTNIQYSGQFTSIEVDPQVRTVDGTKYDVLFIGTDDGKVLKVVNTKSHDSNKKVKPFVIEELKVFETGTAIISLKLIRPWNKPPRLLVTSRAQIHSISLWRCETDKITLCSDCLGLRDPYCVWDKSTHKCMAAINGRKILQGNELIQSISSGTHPECMGELLNKTDQEKMSRSHKSEMDSNNGTEDGEDTSSDRSDVGKVCSDPWQFVGSDCVLIVESELLTWPEARDACKHVNGYLAEPTDFQILINFISENYNFEMESGKYLLGASDIEIEDEWRYAASGQLVPNHIWGFGEPNNYQEQDCMCLWNSQKYGAIVADTWCNRQYKYVCQKGAVVPP